MSVYVAGHVFNDHLGIERCDCGRLWTEIASATKADLGRVGIAHNGVLTEAELFQIELRREAIWRAVWDVAGGAAG